MEALTNSLIRPDFVLTFDGHLRQHPAMSAPDSKAPRSRHAIFTSYRDSTHVIFDGGLGASKVRRL